MFSTIAYAQSETAAQGPSGFEQFLPFIFIFVIFWFFIIRPQSKKLKAHQKFLKEIKVGDSVLTSSGIFGTIKGITDEYVVLEVADDVRIRVLKSYVSGSPNQGDASKKEGQK